MRTFTVLSLVCLSSKHLIQPLDLGTSISITTFTSTPIKMFYDGDLQSGIGKAVREAKLVACFVPGWFYSTKHLCHDASDGLLTMCLQMTARKVNFGRTNFYKDPTSVDRPMNSIP